MQSNHESTQKALKPNTHNVIIKFILNVCKGVAIGVGAILPGISGGVLSVVFGIYQPVINFLSHPFKTFKVHYRLLLPVLIGWALGFIGLARVVDILFRTAQTPAVWLFIGLIAGTFPSLFRSAGEGKRTKSSWIAFGLSFALMLAFMLALSSTAAVAIEPSIFWWVICGILWGVGLIVPGLSPSAFLIFLGLYQPMTAGIASLSPEVIIPLILGIAFVVLLLARLVNWLFEHARSIVFHALCGVVAASTICIIPLNASYAIDDILIYAVCFLGGCACTLLMDHVSIKHKGEMQ